MEAPNAFFPIAILQAPEVKTSAADCPIPMLSCATRVALPNALYPNATLYCPVVAPPNAVHPIATLLTPLVIASAASIPIATL